MRKLFLFCVLLFTVYSCANYEDINVVDVRVDNLSFQSTTQITLTLGVKVDNPTKKTITVSDGELGVYRGDEKLADMTLSTPTVIAAQSNEYNQLALQVEVKNIMALAGLNTNDSKLLEQFDVEGFLKIKSGAASKKIKIDRTSFKNLLLSLK